MVWIHRLHNLSKMPKLVSISVPIHPHPIHSPSPVPQRLLQYNSNKKRLLLHNLVLVSVSALLVNSPSANLALLKMPKLWS
jgi:hypothetical protein